jgi:NAD(P)-dependent dehydrogenase (short-subunit alcohol dehydrogenase family)
MTNVLEGKVAIVTGAGRGIGREHALALADAGAKVVVNDLGGSLSGQGSDERPAEEVANEIRARGGEAAADYENVADFAAAERMVQHAIDAFGRLDILINNAGILRDRMLVNMTEEEWDAVINVHLKGHFAPTRHAAAYWREQSKAGRRCARRGDQHVEPVRRLRQRRTGELRLGEGAIASFTLIAARNLAATALPSTASPRMHGRA